MSWEQTTAGTPDAEAAGIRGRKSKGNGTTPPSTSLEETPHGSIKSISLDKFLAMQLPQREWMVENLIQERGTAMVYAWRGVGKTMFALSLAHAIATGGRFLKWTAKKDRPRTVLYVDGELTAAELQERLKMIAGQTSSATFHILASDLQEFGLPDLSTPAGQAAIEKALEEANADVLFLDNISTLFRSGIENEAESWLPVQQWLLRLRRKGKTVVLIHHAGKGKEQRGTSRREDVLDLVLNLRRPEDYDMDEGARFEVRFEKARSLTGAAAEAFEATLTTTPQGEAMWTWRDLADAKRSEVLELIREGQSVRKIAAQTGMSKSAVQRVKDASVPLSHPLRERDSGTVYSAPGQQPGHLAGQRSENAYAKAKNRE